MELTDEISEMKTKNFLAKYESLDALHIFTPTKVMIMTLNTTYKK